MGSKALVWVGFSEGQNKHRLPSVVEMRQQQGEVAV
jgi:hypothetical protein